jgi:hypothetical protein
MWPEIVAFVAVVLVVGGVIALTVHDALANRRRSKPPETLGTKRRSP